MREKKKIEWIFYKQLKKSWLRKKDEEEESNNKTE